MEKSSRKLHSCWLSFPVPESGTWTAGGIKSSTSDPAVNTVSYNMTRMARYVHVCNRDRNVIGVSTAFWLDLRSTPHKETQAKYCYKNPWLRSSQSPRVSLLLIVLLSVYSLKLPSELISGYP